MYADIAVLSDDYFTIEEEQIKNITSHLTLLGGKIVYSASEFTKEHPIEELPVTPDWSTVRDYGGYNQGET